MTVSRDDLAEVRAWPGGQRASVSAVFGIFGRFVACVHRGHFEVAASVYQLARNEMAMLLRNQRLQASRARARKKVTASP